MSSALKGARRIVVKVGSSLVTNEGRGVDSEAIGNWCRQLAALAAEGRELVMVSSGAIAEGMKRLGWPSRPKELHKLQAAAAAWPSGQPPVANLRFEPGRLTLAAAGWSDAETESFRSQLRPAGWQVEVSEGRLVMSRASSSPR